MHPNLVQGQQQRQATYFTGQDGGEHSVLTGTGQVHEGLHSHWSGPRGLTQALVRSTRAYTGTGQVLEGLEALVRSQYCTLQLDTPRLAQTQAPGHLVTLFTSPARSLPHPRMHRLRQVKGDMRTAQHTHTHTHTHTLLDSYPHKYLLLYTHTYT